MEEKKKTPGGTLRLPKIWTGHKRAWVRCKECGRIQYYQYVPYSLGFPAMTLACGHGLSVRFSEATEGISERDAITALCQLYDEIIDENYPLVRYRERVAS